MGKKIVLISFTIFIFLLFSFIFLINVMEKTKIEEKKSEGVYQGPVPEGYDEDYFRKTGITKSLESNN